MELKAVRKSQPLHGTGPEADSLRGEGLDAGGCTQPRGDRALATVPGRLDGLATAPVPSQPVGKSRRRTERGHDGKDLAATDLEAQPRKGTPAGQGNECAT